MLRDHAVTVVIPTAAVNRWLDEAVESLLPQLSAEDRLVVMHDGVEPDPTRHWMQHRAVVVLHSPERVGVSEASRRAIDATTTPFIARLDGDDIAAPDRIVRQREYLVAHPDVVIVGSRATLIDSASVPVGEFSTRVGERIRHELLRENIVIHSSAMFRRSSYQSTSGYDVRFAMFEDYHLWLRMARLGEVSIMDQSLVSYRVHPTQATRKRAHTGPHMKAVIAEQRALARQLGISSTSAWFRRARWVLIQHALAARVRVTALHARLSAATSPQRT